MKSNKKRFGGFYAAADAHGAHFLIWTKKKKGKKWKTHYVARVHETAKEFRDRAKRYKA